MASSELAALAKKRTTIEDEIEMLVEDLTSAGPNGEPPAGVKGSLVDAEGFPRADIDLYAVRHKRHRLNCLQNDFKDVMKDLERLVLGGGGAVSAKSSPATSAAAPPQAPQAPTATPVEAAEAAPAPAPSKSATGAAPSVASIYAAAGIHINGDGDAVAGNVLPSATSSSRPGSGRGGDGGHKPAPLQPFALVDEVMPGGPAEAAGLRVGDMVLLFGGVSAANHGDLRAVGEVVAASVQQPVAVTVLRSNGSADGSRGDELQLSLVPQPWAGRGLLGCHLRPEPPSA